jgi:hypothetical protein
MQKRQMRPATGGQPDDNGGSGHAWIAAAAAVGALGVFAVTQNRGFSFVDESYLWSLVSNPDASRTSGEIYVFGFVLNPLWRLTGGDIVLYRCVGAFVAATLCGLLAHEVVRRADRVGRPFPRRTRVAFLLTAVAFATLAFTYNNRILSYNSLTVCGLALAGTGLMRAERGSWALSGALIGTAGWLVFTAKPTSAAGLAFLVLCVAPWVMRRPWATLAGAAVTLLVTAGVTFVLVRMTPWDLVTYLAHGLAKARLRGGGSWTALVGLDSPDLLAFLAFGLVLSMPTLVALWGVRLRHRTDGVALTWPLALGTLAIAVFVTTYFDLSLATSGAGHRMRSIALAIPMVAGAAAWLARVDRGSSGSERDVRGVVLALVFLAFPYVYALGSNTPFSLAMANASVFWVIGSGLLLTGLDRVVVLDPVLATAASVAAILAVTSVVDGARDESLLAARVPARVAGTELLMPPTDAQVMAQLDRVRIDNGLDRSTPVVDLTGIGAGYALQLGGRPLGHAFFMGIFPGATDSARYGLSLETCQDRASSWLLYAANNPYDVSPAFTEGTLDLSTDYEVVERFNPTQGPADWRELTVRVLRPRSIAAVAEKLGCP